MKATPVRVRWLLDVTTVCKNGCWFCMSNAGPCGIQVSPARMKYFCRDLNRAQDEGRIVVDEILFTGGGEPAECEDLERIAGYAIGVCGNLGLLTAGATDIQSALRIERFAAISASSSSIAISFNPEDPASCERLERTLTCRLSKHVTVDAKISPMLTANEIDEHDHRLLALYERMGCRIDQVYGIMGDLSIANLGLDIQTPRGSHIKNSFRHIEPFGRARQRLACRVEEITAQTSCAFTQPRDYVIIRSKADHTLVYCSDSQQPGEIPMTYDGIFQIIENQDKMVKQVKAVMSAAIGQKVLYRCDVCPLR